MPRNKQLSPIAGLVLISTVVAKQMKYFLNYSASLLTLTGAILTILQSIYLLWLRFSLFSFAPQLHDPESLSLKKASVAFIQHMTALLLVVSVIEIFLFWLLVTLNMLSRRQGLIATLVLVVLVGFVVLFAFSASTV